MKRNPSTLLRTIVLVFGTFDGLHQGHLNLFRQAKEFGDYLIVIVGRDSTTENYKGKKPKYSEEERLKAVQECELVDEARLGDNNHNPHSDKYTIIKEINPDVICLGYDQIEFKEKLEKELVEMDLKVEVKVLEPYQSEIYKSSLLNK